MPALRRPLDRLVLSLLAAAMTVPLAAGRAAAETGLAASAATDAVAALVATHGESQKPRIERGVVQASERWWAEDGDAAAFIDFCRENFIADEDELAATFDRLTRALEQIDGRVHEIQREVRTPHDLDTGPLMPVDLLLGDLDLASHLNDDLFKTKVAFLALLNYPVDTLADRLANGAEWTRDRWARSRMMDRFAVRVPAAISQEATAALNAADRYIAEYNIRADRLVDAEGRELFPGRGELSLIAHWGLRDELKSHYGEGEDGLARQRAILEVMKRIVRQEIPEAVRGNGDLVWNPWSNEVRPAPGVRSVPDADLARREPDTRYARLLDVFRALRKADPYAPTAPSAILRKFELDRQIPEKVVEALLVSVLASKEVTELGRLIEARLGRTLEPFDIWYAGFTGRAGRSEAELDEIVKARYPTVPAFQRDLPDILRRLGFKPDKARFLAERIVVDPSRGAGHAMEATRREDKTHLRTRIPAGGMLYKGYNIAVHELGHNVEQVFSLHGVDNWWLRGVPNNGFTEAFAFVFQERDMELLGLGAPSAEARRLATLGDLWATYEIAGVALVDLEVWRYLYAHPEATPAELREATLASARTIWNRYYAPVFGVKDSEILAIYSHMIPYPLYLADYPLGHIIAFQVARKLRAGEFGAEFERMARQGRITPDAWMRGAVGSPLSAQPLLDEAHEAMEALR